MERKDLHKMKRSRDKVSLRRYGIYILKCQVATLIFLLINLIPINNLLFKIVLTNLVYGIVFFWIDRLIFQRRHLRMRMWDYK